MNEVILGDCIEIMRSFPSNSFDSIITDPPYGVDYQSAWRTDRTKWKPKIANDKAPFIWWLKEAHRVLKDEGSMACFVRYDVEDDFRRSMRIAGFNPKSQVIWDKVVHGMGDLRGDFAPCHENIIFSTKGRFKFPGKRPKSVLRFPRVSAEKLTHPNEKPVELMEYLISHLTSEGETILDCFAGTGSTLVAAKNTGRNFIGIELNSEYVKIAKQKFV